MSGCCIGRKEEPCIILGPVGITGPTGPAGNFGLNLNPRIGVSSGPIALTPQVTTPGPVVLGFGSFSSDTTDNNILAKASNFGLDGIIITPSILPNTDIEVKIFFNEISVGGPTFFPDDFKAVGIPVLKGFGFASLGDIVTRISVRVTQVANSQGPTLGEYTVSGTFELFGVGS